MKIVLKARNFILKYNFACTLQLINLLDKAYNKYRKTRLWDIYYNKFYTKYYNFYQQYKDYFAILRFTSYNYILFANSFFRKKAVFYW